MTAGHPPPPDHGHDAMPEGEEQAPPGTRTMAAVRWSLVALMALAAVAAWVDHARTSLAVEQASGTQYLCPMHPQIVTTHKGECPICGMDLVPASGEAEGAAAAARDGAPARYTCPMHPAFVSADPKVRCPDCGMKLVPAPQQAGPAAPAAAPAGPPVPGLAPVELSADRVQLIGMRAVPAVREPLGATIRAVGFVAANESALVSVNVRYSGWVEHLAVGQTGQLVQKGEVLASIYSPEMLNAQQVFLNATKWSDRKPGSAAQAPGIANDLERDARLRLELLGVAPQDIDAIAEAGQPLRTVNVRAPVRGYVSRKSVLKGLYVQSGNELFQLADLSTVWVLVDVYESEISRIKVGQQAAFELKAYPGRKFPGRVQFIYPALNTGSRTLQARVELRNPTLELKPGMFGDVTLELGAADAVVVPVEALIDSGEHQYVFVDRGGGRYEPRPVQAGASAGGRVAILAGLAAGELVVTTANFLLDSESRLRAAVEGFNAAPAGPAQGHADHAPPPPAPAPRAAPKPAAASLYTCPMHPDLVTQDAKARCPQCGMKLVPKPPGGSAPATKPPHGEVTKPPHGEVTKPPHGEVTKPPHGEATKPPHGEATKPPHGEAMKAPLGEAMKAPHGEPAPPAPAEPKKTPHGESMRMPPGEPTHAPGGPPAPKPAERPGN